MKKTKIICSIGPASIDPNIMSKMVEAGMNVARLNFSHSDLKNRVETVNAVKKTREITKKNIALLFDTKGPEFRNDNLVNDNIELVEGNTIRVVKDHILGDDEKFSVNYPEALDSINVGNNILLENGLMKLEVISKENDGVTCKIINGGILGNKKV